MEMNIERLGHMVSMKRENNRNNINNNQKKKKKVLNM